MISACGLLCEKCQFYQDPCPGCYQVEGKTFWAKDHTEEGICALYQCAIHNKGFKDCGDCEELPCQKFKDQKDPNISDQEHQLMIHERVATLSKKTNP